MGVSHISYANLSKSHVNLCLLSAMLNDLQHGGGKLHHVHFLSNPELAKEVLTPQRAVETGDVMLSCGGGALPPKFLPTWKCRFSSPSPWLHGQSHSSSGRCRAKPLSRDMGACGSGLGRAESSSRKRALFAL